MHAVYGFGKFLGAIYKMFHADIMIACFDAPNSKGILPFRRLLYPEYKGNRTEKPESSVMQLPYAARLAELCGYQLSFVDGIEADDLIGTWVRKLSEEEEVGEIHLISSDKDFLQLLVYDKLTIHYPNKGVKDMTAVTREDCFGFVGVTPEQVADFKALSGDSSDNYHGVPNIGEKTAQKLLLEHGSLEGIYKNLHNIKPKIQEKLIEGIVQAWLCQSIATIKTNLDEDGRTVFFEDIYDLIPAFDGEAKREFIIANNLLD